MSEPNETLNRSGRGVAREKADISKSEACISTQEARDSISKDVQDSLAPIVAKAITLYGCHDAAPPDHFPPSD
jgi:hypothetical protein